MSTTSSRLSTRTLLACVVLGALGAVIIHASRFLGVALQATLPWLSFPAPLPWFLTILIAPLLTQRVGTALLTSIVTMIVGFGALALVAGVVIEGAFLGARFMRTPRSAWPPLAKPYWLFWAIVSAVLVSLMSFGFMFMFQEFMLLDTTMKLVALVVRVLLGVLYGVLAWLIARSLLRAGVNPQRIALQ